MASSRPKGFARKTGINVLPILLYVGLAAVVTIGMYAWDVQYRKGIEASRRPPEPDLIARNLVENIESLKLAPERILPLADCLAYGERKGFASA